MGILNLFGKWIRQSPADHRTLEEPRPEAAKPERIVSELNRVSCSKCGVMILSSVADRYNGFCVRCAPPGLVEKVRAEARRRRSEESPHANVTAGKVESASAREGTGVGPQKQEGTAAGRIFDYGRGTIEDFYADMSKDLIRVHGPLMRVDYITHYPTFAIWFFYKDGTSIYSGQRTGRHDIHFLSLGYVGEGPRYAEQFLAAAGFILTSEEIESIDAGDGIELRGDKPIIVRKRDKVNEDEVVKFSHERNEQFAGFPAIYRHYKAPSKDSAMVFLGKQTITAQSFFIVVETPEGTFCKDRMGLFEGKQ